MQWSSETKTVKRTFENIKNGYSDDIQRLAPNTDKN